MVTRTVLRSFIGHLLAIAPSVRAGISSRSASQPVQAAFRSAPELVFARHVMLPLLAAVFANPQQTMPPHFAQHSIPKAPRRVPHAGGRPLPRCGECGLPDSQANLA